MSTHLSKGKLNIGLVQERARKELLDLIDKCEGSKVLLSPKKLIKNLHFHKLKCVTGYCLG